MSDRKPNLVVLQRRGTAQDAAGQPIEDWTTLRREWAEITPTSGREFMAASGERADVTHKVCVWYGSGVLPRDRILYGTRTFDIISVLDKNEGHRELDLMCREIVG